MPDVPLAISVGATIIPVNYIVRVPRTPLEVMHFVVALLSDPLRYHRGSPAADAAGGSVSPLCATATGWDLEGAIDRAVCADGIDLEDERISGVEYKRRARLSRRVWGLFDASATDFIYMIPHHLLMIELRRAYANARKLDPKRRRVRRRVPAVA